MRVHPDGRQVAFSAGSRVNVEDLWVMEGDKAHVSGATAVKKDNGVHETLALKSQAEFDKNMEVAQACPVNCIHLLKDGVKAI